MKKRQPGRQYFPAGGLALPPLDLDCADDDRGDGTIALVGRGAADSADYVHAIGHFSKHGVPIVEVGGRSQRDEELPAVGIRPSVCHGEDAGLVVPQLWMELVFERISRAADALAEWIASLNHESVDHPVEDYAVVIRLRHGLVGAGILPRLGAFGQADEVRNRLGSLLIEQADGKATLARVELCKQTHRPCLLPRWNPDPRSPIPDPRSPIPDPGIRCQPSATGYHAANERQRAHAGG